jgi:hypothetical protein
MPLVLAGPILRRVEPSQVSVWIALSKSAMVALRVWEGIATSDAANVYMSSAQPVPTVRVAANLHIVVVTISSDAPDPVVAAATFKTLKPETVYTYDLVVRFDGQTHDDNLTTLGMLTASQPTDPVLRLPLGYEPGKLPGFALPPADLSKVNILYGSCRRPGHPDPDALAYVDDLISGPLHNTYKDPIKRPHQLFLGGDQIYADDVVPLHLLLVMDLAERLLNEHLGAADPVADPPTPVEKVRVDSVASAPATTPPTAFDKDPSSVYKVDPAVTDAEIPIDRLHFPEGRRVSVTRREAQLTSEDGKSHVIGLGEFAALYLSVWSNAVWGEYATGAKFAADENQPGDTRALRWQEDLPAKGLVVMPPVKYPTAPDVIAGSFYEENPESDDMHPTQHLLRFHHQILKEFHKALAKVQRALANVATYMILDDHDVTDDYFLNPIWCRRVLTRKLGVEILRNGMTAYALFQDWGNDPLTYLSGPKQQLLALIPSLFEAGKPTGPDRPTAEFIAQLLGYDKPLINTPDGRYDHVKPPLTWHFMIDGPAYRVVALDNRTRRSYASAVGPPGNVSVDALVDQIPLSPMPVDKQVLVVIAPLQVIGPPTLDEIVAPLTYRVADAVIAGKGIFKEYVLGKKDDSALSPHSTTGLREMTGTNPDAIEAWAFDAVTFEHVLKRLAPYGRVVLLSGDVHYSSGTVMSYWTQADPEVPARFAQFTSSGFKNVMPAMVTFADRALGLAQQLARANIANERIGWFQPDNDLVVLPPGHTEAELGAVMRSRLQATPVLIPSWGWPDDNDPSGATPYDPAKASQLNAAHPFDWCWRVKPLIDGRTEDQRPAGIRLLEIDEPAVIADLSDPSTVLEGYQALAARHQHALDRLRAARQILFRANLGRLTFTTYPDGRLDAIHDVITVFTDPSATLAIEPQPEIFLQQVAPLGPEPEAPPTVLRTKALVIPKQQVPS